MMNPAKLLLVLVFFLLLPCTNLFPETRIDSATIDRATAEVNRSMREEAEKQLMLFPEEAQNLERDNKYIRWEDIGKDWIPVNTGTEKDEKKQTQVEK